MWCQVRVSDPMSHGTTADRSLVHQAGPFRIRYLLVLISLDFNKENTAPYVALEWNKCVLCFHTRSVRTKVALRAAIKVSQRKQLRQLLWRRKPSPARRPHHGNLLLCSCVLCTDDTLRSNVQGTWKNCWYNILNLACDNSLFLARCSVNIVNLATIAKSWANS